MVSRTSVAVLAGMAVAGAVLVAPGVVAAPTAGRAAAWGHNTYGQLGNSTTATSTVPVAVNADGVLAGKTITAISAGYHHSCAVADGRAYCWGYNGYGQLGNGNTTDSTVPVAVDPTGVLAGKTVTTIAVGSIHTCALADGRAYCWGHNDSGRLGNNDTIDSWVPVAVESSGVLAGRVVTSISVGAHSCAVADGKAYCWGDNTYGQLGHNTGPTDSWVPAAVDASGVLAGKTITSISASSYHSCAVGDGKAYCWGYNNSGRLGDGSTTNSSVPLEVDASMVLAGRTVSAISAGEAHSCAVVEGRASCWGANTYGQLGNKSKTDSWVPVAVDTSGVLAGKTVTAITGGTLHSCAVADGRAYCWGANGGRLGNGGTIDSWVPVAVDTSGVLAGKTVTAITGGGLHTAALSAEPPKPPAAVAGVGGDRSATMSWAPPADDGGSPVLEYVATAIPGGASCSTTGLSCVVSGLANGTPYTFTVTARNAIGVSAPSAPSAPVIPTAPPVTPAAPGKVTGVKAKVRKGTVKITWKAVAGATSYRARISKPGGKKYRAWKTTSKRVFKAKVRKGTKYRFQVAAIGAGGRGPTTTIRFKGK